MMKHSPQGIYVVAIVFFLAGLLCIVDLSPPIFYVLGFDKEKALLRQPGFQWVLVGWVLASWLLLYGVFLLTRLHPVPQWAFFAMTLFLMVQMLSEPAGDSPFYSRRQIYLNRFLLLLPLLASCVYLLRPRFRESCRKMRATTIDTRSRTRL